LLDTLLQSTLLPSIANAFPFFSQSHMLVVHDAMVVKYTSSNSGGGGVDGEDADVKEATRRDAMSVSERMHFL
jgi:hypothetical protein